ncbi:Nodulin-like-domain-containing protein [Tribonema minus]|uniref:Nodulin-like-domain-containing protein n=1 Tax=Tribonema minus TaxID=303371 RepID=A0A836CQ73_9STRA|nr:Nodulin-like-domain-containing protein [Tribonema minus]
MAMAWEENLGYSQRSLDLVASFGELGMWSTFLVGLVLEHVPPRRVFVLGALVSCAGLMYIAVATDNKIESSVATVAGAYYAANLGIAAFQTAAQSICVRNFPAVDRGKICGLLKSILGLSSAILAALFQGLFGEERVITFLFVIGSVLPTAALIAAVPFNVVPAAHLSYVVEAAQGVTPTLNHFLRWYAALIAAIVIGIALTALAHFLRWYAALIAAIVVGIALTACHVTLPAPYWGIGVLLLITGVLAVPCCYGSITIKSAAAEDADEPLMQEVEPLLGTPLLGTVREGDNGGGVELEGSQPAFACAVTVAPALAKEGDGGMTWVEAMQDARFWALLFAFLCGAGSGLVVINNIASIADSLGVPSSSLLVSIIGLCNAGGRFTAGATMLCFNLTLSACVSLLLSAGVPELLYLGAALAGIAYGSMFSVVLAVCGDCFGTRHIATIYGLLDLGDCFGTRHIATIYGLLDVGPASGSFLFATLLVNVTYGIEPDCLGSACFSGTFAFCAGAAAFATATTYIALVRPGLQLRRAERRRAGAEAHLIG